MPHTYDDLTNVYDRLFVYLPCECLYPIIGCCDRPIIYSNFPKAKITLFTYPYILSLLLLLSSSRCHFHPKPFLFSSSFLFTMPCTNVGKMLVVAHIRHIVNTQFGKVECYFNLRSLQKILFMPMVSVCLFIFGWLTGRLSVQSIHELCIPPYPNMVKYSSIFSRSLFPLMMTMMMMTKLLSFFFIFVLFTRIYEIQIIFVYIIIVDCIGHSLSMLTWFLLLLPPMVTFFPAIRFPCIH